MLQHPPYLTLRRIEVTVTGNGDVCLMGRVPSFFMKQLAQVAVIGVDGVRSLENTVAATPR